MREISAQKPLEKMQWPCIRCPTVSSLSGAAFRSLLGSWSVVGLSRGGKDPWRMLRRVSGIGGAGKDQHRHWDCRAAGMCLP